MEKRKSPRKLVWVFRILFLVFLVTFLFSGTQLLKEWKRYRDAEQEYDQLASSAKIEVTLPKKETPSQRQEASANESQDIAQTEEAETSSASSSVTEESPAPAGPLGFQIDFNYLSSLNPDIRGWIYIPNTRIDYPVMQTDNNEYYLSYSFMGQFNWVGCPFIDYRIAGDYTAPTTMIYGHDLENEAMFPDIKKYRDQSFYESNPYLYILAPDRTLRYQVFSCHTASETDFAAFRLQYEDEEDFQEYLDYILSMKHYDTGVDVTSEDRILSLVTCEADRDYRFVLNAVLVEEIPR